jgi:hypothetical protein
MTSSPSDPENPFNFQFNQTQNSKSQQGTAYAKKVYKPTPWTARNRDEQRERRRNMFLRRVEADRDEKRFGVRSDEVSFNQMRFGWVINIDTAIAIGLLCGKKTVGRRYDAESNARIGVFGSRGGIGDGAGFYE